MKIKVIALIGEAGSGKDSLLQEVKKVFPQIHEIISCTTRPKREGEKEGVNYFYLSQSDFWSKILRDDMLEYTEFNSWFYGTSKEMLSAKINIGVFNPAGIRQLIKQGDIELQVFYITASNKTRLLRQLNRENSPDVDEIVRRYSTDKEDFSHLNFEYIKIDNNGDMNLAVEKLIDNISEFTGFKTHIYYQNYLKGWEEIDQTSN